LKIKFLNYIRITSIKFFVKKFLFIYLLRILNHLFLIFVLCFIYIVLNNYNYTLISLINNIILSTIAADIFYIFTVIIPEVKKKRYIYEIGISTFSNCIDNFLNSLFSILHFNNNKDYKVNVHELNSDSLYKFSSPIIHIIETSELWDKPFITCNWRLFRSNLNYTGYGQKMYKLSDNSVLTYKDKFQLSIEQLEISINEIIVKYGQFFDKEYLEALENFICSPIVTYKNKDIDDFERYVYIGLKYILKINELNIKYSKKYHFNIFYRRFA
jgi:hypothetical protein